MTVLESILKNLETLPNPKLVEVARYEHGLTETAQEERRALLDQTHGALSPEDGELLNKPSPLLAVWKSKWHKASF